MDKIYFDYASTTPCDPDVIKAMQPYFYEKFGNPSSPHAYGQEAQKALEEARGQLAAFIGAKPQEIVFNSGATEANNHAVFGIAHRFKEKGNHIILSPVEHHSVTESVEALRRQGFDITYLSVDEDGKVDPQELQNVITDQTILIAIMNASNEIGTIQPVDAVGAIAQERKIPFLVDAVQAVGHIPVNVDDIHADLLSLSAHKFYGPKGIGALYIREGTKCEKLLKGGDQERDQRASTQNVAGAVGLACAIAICKEKMAGEAELQMRLRNKIIDTVSKKIDGVKVNGHVSDRLPNNVHFSFEGIEGESLLMSLDMNNIAASMGSACTSGAMEASHVLRAIGLTDELAFGSLRITLGRWTTQEDVDYLLDQLPHLVSNLRP